ncbi:putative TLC domain-containing C17A2.02c-like protein [Cladobotryum mycophilum]|uniref:TLC domain-containing C17A2.02c-like protein n=1 Tax=Cladobotryum mycophilum TaxID=491253 RepID=A0ABR0SV75_9HYPO
MSSDFVSPSLSWLGSSQPVQSLASYFGLRTLPIHVDWAVLSLAFFTVLYSHIAEPLTKHFIPKQWAAFTDKEKADWKMRSVSMAQSLVLGPASLYVLWAQYTQWESRTRVERVFGYYEPETWIANVALGYFIWHFVMMVIEYKKHGLEMVIHAVVGVSFLGGVYQPFINNMTPWFLLYELTNISQNMYRFLARLGKGTSGASVANAIVWIVTFFFTRILWGTYATFVCCHDVFVMSRTALTAKDLGVTEFASLERLRAKGLDPWPPSVFMVGWVYARGIALAALNFIWFYLIVKTTAKKLAAKNAAKTME